ncbi:MAG: PAAR domain-containing protein [Myxococcota bacterium]
MTAPRPPQGAPTVAPGTVRPSTKENPGHRPLIAPTGNVTVNALAHVVNQAAAPFTDPPPPNEGNLQAVSRNVSGALGVVGAAFSLADTGMALATAKVAALFPALPAVTLGGMYIGPPHCHAHPPSLIPPAPTPVPLPSIGTIMVAGCVSVLIGGIPAARCGDYGLAPTCGGFMPIFEIKTGSSQVFIGGSRAARLMDFAKACPGPPEPPGPPKPPSRLAQAMTGLGIAGVGAGALAAAAQQSAMLAAQAAADAAALAMGMLYGKDPSVPPAIASLGVVMPMQGTVLIGGFPMPDTLAAITGLLKGFRMLARGLRGGRRAGKLFCLRC